MSNICRGADSVDRPEIHVEQDDALARLGSFSSCPPASAFQKVDFGGIVLGADFFSANLSKLINSSKIWAESAGLVAAYYDSVMSKVPNRRSRASRILVLRPFFSFCRYL